MRISDWSSDVCSSDLLGDEALAEDAEFAAARRYAPSATLATLGHAKARFGPFAVIDGATVRMAGDVTSATPRQFAAMRAAFRSEEHTSELQSLMRISYAVFCLKKKTTRDTTTH